MERLTFRLHRRSVQGWRQMNYGVRRLIELMVLCSAVATLGSIFYLHTLSELQMSPSGSQAKNCLSDSLNMQGFNVTETNKGEFFPIIRLHISDESGIPENLMAHKANFQSSFDAWTKKREYLNDGSRAPTVGADASSSSAAPTGFSLWNTVFDLRPSHDHHHSDSSKCMGSSSGGGKQSSQFCSILDGDPRASTALFDFYERQRVYMFSLQKGLLLLPPQHREKLNVPVVDVVIPKGSECMGSDRASWLLEWIVGYDPVAVQWCLDTLGQRGFLYNTRTKQMVELDDALPQPQDSLVGKLLFKANSITCAVFLFFCCSTLVSFTLRETQLRMLRFTYLLQHHIRHELPIFALVFTHVTESLLFVPVMVGLFFFVRQFFDDQLLSFIVITLVWVAEVFSVVSLRTALATNFFPRVFAIYLVFFLLYYFHYPRGYSLLAVGSLALFGMHAMIYCMNAIEIPAFEAGLITELVMREPLPTIHEQPEGSSSDSSGGGGGGGGGNNSSSSRRAVLAAAASFSRTGATPPRPPRRIILENERRRRAANELLTLRHVNGRGSGGGGSSRPRSPPANFPGVESSSSGSGGGGGNGDDVNQKIATGLGVIATGAGTDDSRTLSDSSQSSRTSGWGEWFLGALPTEEPYPMPPGMHMGGYGGVASISGPGGRMPSLDQQERDAHYY